MVFISNRLCGIPSGMDDESMSTRLRFEDRAGYLHAEIECAALTARDAMGALAEILHEAANRHARKIMVKCTVASSESDKLLFNAVVLLASLRSSSRIAFVECQTPSHEHAASGPDIKLFDDEKTAEAWLFEEA